MRHAGDQGARGQACFLSRGAQVKLFLLSEVELASPGIDPIQ